MSALVKEAAITALKETLPMMSLLHQRNDNTSDYHAPINTNENTSDPQAAINTVVKHCHFISAFSKITPSVSKEVKVFPMLFLIILSFSRIKSGIRKWLNKCLAIFIKYQIFNALYIRIIDH